MCFERDRLPQDEQRQLHSSIVFVSLFFFFFFFLLLVRIYIVMFCIVFFSFFFILLAEENKRRNKPASNKSSIKRFMLSHSGHIVRAVWGWLVIAVCARALAHCHKSIRGSFRKYCHSAVFFLLYSPYVWCGVCVCVPPLSA